MNRSLDSSPTGRHRPPLVAVGWLALLALPIAGAGDPPASMTYEPDCGFNALFLLLELEGRGVDPATLERRLPVRTPDGYSMAELIRAASASGLELEGVRIGPGDPPPRRPAIAHFRTDKGGHFAVVRPVGSTGSLVQLFDPPYDPRVVDRAELASNPSWTGQILIPKGGISPLWSAILCLAAIATSWAIIAARAAAIRRRSVHRGA